MSRQKAGADLCLEVIYHIFHSKGGICKQANVVCNPSVTRRDEVREAEIGRVILFSLLPQPMESAHTKIRGFTSDTLFGRR